MFTEDVWAAKLDVLRNIRFGGSHASSSTLDVVDETLGHGWIFVQIHEMRRLLRWEDTDCDSVFFNRYAHFRKHGFSLEPDLLSSLQLLFPGFIQFWKMRNAVFFLNLLDFFIKLNFLFALIFFLPAISFSLAWSWSTASSAKVDGAVTCWLISLFFMTLTPSSPEKKKQFLLIQTEYNASKLHSLATNETTKEATLTDDLSLLGIVHQRSNENLVIKIIMKPSHEHAPQHGWWHDDRYELQSGTPRIEKN